MTRVSGKVAAGLSSKLNLATDLLALVAALMVSKTFAGQSPSAPDGAGTLWLFLAALCTWTLTGAALHQYEASSYHRQRIDDAASSTVLVLGVATLLAMLAWMLPNVASLPRIVPFVLLDLPATLALRALFRALAVREEDPNDEVLIVGLSAIGRQTADDLGHGGRKVLGFLKLKGDVRRDAARVRQSRGARALLGAASRLEEVLRKIPVGEVFISGNALTQGEEMQSAVAVCERLGVPFALPAWCFRLERARPADTRSIGDGYVHYLSIESKPRQMALKRLFDIAMTGLALWVLLPLFVVVAAAIKLTSKGPVFFRQRRVGLNGRPFYMLKFRSMVVDAEALRARLEAQNEMSGPVFKMKNDPRITAVGRFIRKYSIDELPQLVNVLRGEMSVVGPRPPLPKEVANYEAWQLRRLSVRPGLTCIWQVSGRNQISFEEWMYLDLRYIDHWTLLSDFTLIARTLPVVLTGRGAS